MQRPFVQANSLSEHWRGTEHRGKRKLSDLASGDFGSFLFFLLEGQREAPGGRKGKLGIEQKLNWNPGTLRQEDREREKGRELLVQDGRDSEMGLGCTTGGLEGMTGENESRGGAAAQEAKRVETPTSGSHHQASVKYKTDMMRCEMCRQTQNSTPPTPTTHRKHLHTALSHKINRQTHTK